MTAQRRSARRRRAGGLGAAMPGRAAFGLAVLMLLSLLGGAGFAGQPHRLATLITRHSEVSALAFSPDNSLMLTGGGDGTLELWELPAGRHVRGFEEHADRVMAAAFSPDGRMAATAGYEKTIRLWDVRNGVLLRSLDAGTEFTSAIVFVPDSRLIAAGGDDRKLRLWDIDSGKLVRTMKMETGTATMGIVGLSVTRDGKTLAVGSTTNARLLDMRSYRQLRELKVPASTGLKALALSADGGDILIGEGNGAVKLWEAGSGRPVWTRPGDNWVMQTLAFSADRRRALSVHGDRTLRISDAATGRPLESIKTSDQDPNGFSAAAFAPDGGLVAVWGAGNEVTLWSTDGEPLSEPAATAAMPPAPAPAATALPAMPVAVAAATPATGKRLALVIGNSAYRHVSPLSNPKNDALLIEAALREAGFTVTRVLDADLAQMRRALLAFGRTLREKDVEAGLIYYAGHGVQVNGENYLVPVSAQIADEDEIPIETLNANDVLRTLEAAGSRINIVILDACRNNPFARSVRSAARGLAPVDAPRGTVIAYATSPGDVASDGEAGNSPYAAALARSIGAGRGLPIESVFKSTRRDVLAATGEKQVPWETSSITGEFYFHPPDGAAPTALVAAVPAAAPAAVLPPPVPEPPRQQVAMAPIHEDPPTRATTGCRRLTFDAGPATLCASSVLDGQLGNTYGVGNLADGNRATAWVEGARGDGLDERLLVRFDQPTRIRRLSLVNGYDKNADIFNKNNRVGQIALRTSRGEVFDASLQDHGGWQELVDRDLGEVNWIELSITRVHRGSKYRDTAISELRIE